MAGLQGAVESAAPVSRLHEQRSYDPADFPVPTGREEEWRFTPLRRLRGLHTDQTLAEGKVTVDTDPAEAVASRPTIISVRGEEAAGAAFGHLVVDVAPLAEAVLVLDHQGSATYADNVEIIVGDGASLSLVSVQDWAPDAVHASHHHATIGRDARLRHTAVTIGGGVVRLAPSVRYAGPGGDAEL